MLRRRMKRTGAFLLIIFIFSCRLPVKPGETAPPPLVQENPEVKILREKIVEGAYHLLDTKNLNIRDKSFNTDCSGTVLAIYYYAGIDLSSEFGNFTGSGVERIHALLVEYKLLHKDKIPKPGDIIFWDNTYDKNGDKKWNDELTHAGIVVEVGENGNIRYLHYNYSKGIIVEEMNLF